MPNPFNDLDMEEDSIYINGGHVYDETIEEVENMPEILRSLDLTIVRFVAVVVRPEDTWEGPSDGSNLDETVECSKRGIPHSSLSQKTKSRQGSNAVPAVDDRKEKDSLIDTKISFCARRRQSIGSFKMVTNVKQAQLQDNTGLPTDKT